MHYFLDSTFAIDYLRAHVAALGRLERLFASGDAVYINEVVVCELATGARPTDERGVAAFIRAMEFVQPAPEVALLAGRWRGEARRRGFTISVPDALIAATADSLGATLITRNVRDFSQMPIAIEGY